MIYDRKRNPENRDLMTFEEDGETFSTYFLLPRTREELQRRFELTVELPRGRMACSVGRPTTSRVMCAGW